jgi:hypothetical protein
MGWFQKKDEEAPRRPPPAGPGDGQVRLPDLSTALPANHRAFLVSCCDQRTPVVATWVDLGVVRRAVLHGIDNDQILLLVTDHGALPYAFRPRAQCVVSFFIQERVVTFVAYEEPSERPDGHDELLLTMPTQIAVEGRTRYRVPILPSAGLRAAVLSPAGRRTQVEPMDISPAGIMLRVAEGVATGLEQGQICDLELLLGPTTCRVPISLRHRGSGPDGERFGCLFHCAANGFVFPREKELTELVMTLERHWMRNRAR